MIEERMTDPTAEVARLLPRALRWLFAPLAESSPLGELPPPLLRALWLLRQRDALTMHEVAEGLGVAMSTATQLADRLERMGLVERRADAADRRVVRLGLTEAGRAAIAEQARVQDARIAAAMERLSPRERDLVLQGVRLLERSARGSDLEPAPLSLHRAWDLIGAMLPPSVEGHE